MHKHYSLLGLENGADKEAIKSAFRRLAMVFHPDRDPASGQRFHEICQAYDQLMKHFETDHYLSATTSHVVRCVKFNQNKSLSNPNRRLGKRGSPGDRRFESVMEQEYKGVHVRHLV